MSLLREIQYATCSQELNLADTLRKCKILAVRLNHAPFKNWVDSELNGYQSNNDLPQYRILNDVELQGNFNNGIWFVRNISIPTLSFPEDYSKFITKLTFTQSVSSLKKLVDDINGPVLRFALPANIIQLV